MAMVNIERDGKQLRVPYGAFKNSFERAGWNVAEGPRREKHSSPNKNTNGGGKTSPEASDDSKKASDVKDGGGKTSPEASDDSKKASDVKDEWDEADEELEMEKSIDEMDMKELKEFAESKGVDTKELKTVGALKKAIRAVM